LADGAGPAPDPIPAAPPCPGNASASGGPARESPRALDNTTQAGALTRDGPVPPVIERAGVPRRRLALVVCLAAAVVAGAGLLLVRVSALKPSGEASAALEPAPRVASPASEDRTDVRRSLQRVPEAPPSARPVLTPVRPPSVRPPSPLRSARRPCVGCEEALAQPSSSPELRAVSPSVPSSAVRVPRAPSTPRTRAEAAGLKSNPFDP